MSRALCPSSFPLTRITSGEDDWAAQPSARLLGMAQQLILIRCFERKLLWLKDRDLINGPVHTSVGQEAVAYGFMTHQALEAARRLVNEGIDVEVIDLRTVDDAGMDYTLIGQSIVKTGALLTVEEAPHCNSIGAKIAMECVRRYYDYFDGPPAAVTAPDIPMPVSRRLEQACIPTLDQICEAMLKTAKRQA